MFRNISSKNVLELEREFCFAFSSQYMLLIFYKHRNHYGKIYDQNNG
ncbi:conserved hypothetical protein [delta proteobacterium NaphS2]|nr:conserved hypothetical protein [delta proteobacterium NaphS2]